MSKEKNEKGKKQTPDLNKETEEKLESIPKDELLKKYLEEREKLKMEKEDKEKSLLEIGKNGENKDSELTKISQKHKILIKQLEELKNELDNKIEVVQSKNISRLAKKEIKTLSYEKTMKIKEKELKNVSFLINILKKDKLNLENDLQNKANFDVLLKLEEKFKSLEMKNLSLMGEIKHYNRMVKEHKRCLENSKNYDLELKGLRDDKHKESEKFSEALKKLQVEQEKHAVTKNNFNNIKQMFDEIKIQCESNLKNINSDEDKKKKNIKIFNKIEKSKDDTYNPIFKQYDPYQEHINKKRNPSKQPEKFGGKTFKMEALPIINQTEGGENDKSVYLSEYLSKSLLVQSRYNVEEPRALFSAVEKEYLKKKNISIEDIEKYEKKFENAEKERILSIKQLKKELKALNNKLGETQEKVTLMNLDMKEIEQKSKIYNLQIHEYKNEVNGNKTKIEDFNNKIKSLNLLLKEKDNDNSYLATQIQHLTRMAKTNDEKRVRKIKSKEESQENNDNKTNDEEEVVEIKEDD